MSFSITPGDFPIPTFYIPHFYTCVIYAHLHLVLLETTAANGRLVDLNYPDLWSRYLEYIRTVSRTTIYQTKPNQTTFNYHVLLTWNKTQHVFTIISVQIKDSSSNHGSLFLLYASSARASFESYAKERKQVNLITGWIQLSQEPFTAGAVGSRKEKSNEESVSELLTVVD